MQQSMPFGIIWRQQSSLKIYECCNGPEQTQQNGTWQCQVDIFKYSENHLIPGKRNTLQKEKFCTLKEKLPITPVASSSCSSIEQVFVGIQEIIQDWGWLNALASSHFQAVVIICTYIVGILKSLCLIFTSVTKCVILSSGWFLASGPAEPSSDSSNKQSSCHIRPW